MNIFFGGRLDYGRISLPEKRTVTNNMTEFEPALQQVLKCFFERKSHYLEFYIGFAEPREVPEKLRSMYRRIPYPLDYGDEVFSLPERDQIFLVKNFAKEFFKLVKDRISKTRLGSERREWFYKWNVAEKGKWASFLERIWQEDAPGMIRVRLDIRWHNRNRAASHPSPLIFDGHSAR